MNARQDVAAAPALSVLSQDLTPAALRQSLGCFPSGVTVVTARAADGRPVGLTVNSFASLSLEPPLLLWSLANRSPNRQTFRQATHFAIHVLAAHQGDTALQFANSRLPDKFQGVAMQPPLWAEAPPLLADSHALFLCESRDAIESGDHTLFIGRVQQHSRGAGAPLLFYRGQFGELNGAPAAQ